MTEGVRSVLEMGRQGTFACAEGCLPDELGNSFIGEVSEAISSGGVSWVIWSMEL